MSKLVGQQNCHVTFTPQYCFMQALSLRRPQVLGELFAGLYLFKPRVAVSAEDAVRDQKVSSLDSYDSVCNASMANQDIWHARLGHLPLTKLQKLGLLSKYTDIDSIKQCLVCSKARQHRLPFPHSQIHTIYF